TPADGCCFDGLPPRGLTRSVDAITHPSRGVDCQAIRELVVDIKWRDTLAFRRHPNDVKSGGAIRGNSQVILQPERYHGRRWQPAGVQLKVQVRQRRSARVATLTDQLPAGDALILPDGNSATLQMAKRDVRPVLTDQDDVVAPVVLKILLAKYIVGHVIHHAD